MSSDNDFVCCAICGIEFNVISWRHLAHHNLTLKQYKEIYPNNPTMSISASIRSKEASIKSNASRKGQPISEQTKLKISQTKKQNPTNAWNKGLPRTIEQNKQLSDKRKQKFKSGEITHWNTGNSTPTDVKNKISQTSLNQHRSFSEESKQKRIITIDNKKNNNWIHPSTVNFLDNLSTDSLGKFNDKDWLYEQHITNKRTISSICVELGLHWKNSSKTIKKQLEYFDIPIHYWHQASSIQQRDVEQFILNSNTKIETRNRKLIYPYELDIFLQDYNIAIEYCGLYWHSSEYKNNNYHKIKYDMCNKLGIRLITIFSDEWLYNRTLVEHKILNLIGKSTDNKINGRSCVLYNPNNAEKKQFFEQYHIQGNGPGSITIGLSNNNILVAMMTFIDKGNGSFVLNRYATSCNVRGGFSKLLKHFKNNYQWNEIISFADLRWSEGDLYKTNGFVLDKILPPDYCYVVQETRVHKFNFRRKNLPNIIDHFDPSLSEIQNTTKAGFHRIYNCGLQRWVILNSCSGY